MLKIINCNQRKVENQLTLDVQCIKRTFLIQMSQQSTVSCQVWEVVQQNISKDLEAEFVDERHTYGYFLWTSIIIQTFFGNFLLGAIWHYERFGGDSKKRSLQNQLASHIIIACLLIMNSNNISPLNQAKRFASYEVLVLYTKVRRAIHFIQLDLIVLHTFVVYMQVVVWKRLRECNEELIIRTTCITIYLGNLVLSLLCPIEEKIKLYLYVIGGSPMPLRSHVAGEHQIFSK